MQGLLYVLGCIAVPTVWGLFMYHAFGWRRERRRRLAVAKVRVPPVDYTI